MNEKEWLACEDPEQMLGFLRENASDRKIDLFRVAQCRTIWHLLTDERSRDVVITVERSADGLATVEERLNARRAARLAMIELRRSACVTQVEAGGEARQVVKEAFMDAAAAEVAYQSAGAGIKGNVFSYFDAGLHDEQSIRLAQDAREELLTGTSCICRDIFGNPFRPVTFDPAWRTDTAVALARSMYETRDFGAMPILADALQDAGCDSDDILNHCRGPGPHVRGCWVVDLVLGKE